MKLKFCQLKFLIIERVELILKKIEHFENDHMDDNGGENNQVIVEVWSNGCRPHRNLYSYVYHIKQNGFDLLNYPISKNVYMALSIVINLQIKVPRAKDKNHNNHLEPQTLYNKMQLGIERQLKDCNKPALIVEKEAVIFCSKQRKNRAVKQGLQGLVFIHSLFSASKFSMYTGAWLVFNLKSYKGTTS